MIAREGLVGWWGDIPDGCHLSFPHQLVVERLVSSLPRMANGAICEVNPGDVLGSFAFLANSCFTVWRDVYPKIS